MKYQPIRMHTICIITILLALTGCKRTVEDVAKWKNQENVEQLTRALSDAQPPIRLASVKALGILKDANTAGPVANLLSDADAQVAVSAARTLEEINSIQAQDALIEALAIERAAVRKTAADALGARKVKRATQPLITLLEDPSEEVVLSAAITLGVLAAPEAVAPLTAKLESRSSKVRLACVEGLAHMNEPSIAPKLANLLNDLSRKVQLAAIDALVQLGAPAMPHVVQCLRSEDPKASKNAMTVLEKANAVPTSGCDLVYYQLARISAQNHKRVDVSVVKDLAQPEAEAILINMLSHNKSILREYAYQALETIGEACTPGLIEAVKDQAGPSANAWFNERNCWCGAPSWKLDFWGAVTALSPTFKRSLNWENSLKSGSIEPLRMLSRNKKISREQIPLLIGQLSPQRSDSSINFFGLKAPDSAKNKVQQNEARRLATRALISAGELALFPLQAAHEHDTTNTLYSGILAKLEPQQDR